MQGDADASKKALLHHEDRNNCWCYDGVLNIYTAVPVIIKNLTIAHGYKLDSNHFTGGAGIYVSHAGACLTLTEGAVIKNNDSGYGTGGIQIIGTAESPATLIMNSTAAVYGNMGGSNKSGGIDLIYANMCMSGQAIVGSIAANRQDVDRNYASGGHGGGIYVDAYSKLYMGYSSIPSNPNPTYAGDALSPLEEGYGVAWNGADLGGGIYCDGTVYMASGSISDNSTPPSTLDDNIVYFGGGVYVSNSGTFNMYGGKISGNKAQRGGGVYVGKTFNMYGGTIGAAAPEDSNGKKQTAQAADGKHSNYASENGGGIFLGSDATTLNISGGTIEYNYAGASGGGIYLGKSASLTGPTDTQIAAGASPLEISYNYAVGGASNKGGGGIASFTSEFSLQNATMKGNKVSSSGYGGAILLPSAAQDRYVSMSGNISIPDASDKNNDILLGHNGTTNYNYINVNGALGGAGTIATLHQNDSVTTNWQVVKSTGNANSAYALPKVAGRFEYITTGSEASKKYVVDGAGKPLQLNPFESDVPIGAFVIDDIDKGYWIGNTATLTEALKEKICAVIFFNGYNGNVSAVNNGALTTPRILGIGLKSTEGPLFSDSSSGYVLADYDGTVCDGLVCTPSAYSGSVIFEGTRNGSASYTYVSMAFGDMSKANYPALYFAYDYAGKDGTHVPSNGYYYRNWYIPSIAEVYQLFQNKTTVETSLQKVLGTDATLGDSVASSSQKSDAPKSIFSMSSSGDIVFWGISLANESTFFWPIHEF